jgi:nuclear transport factor 2 (NTF2) superfamily protein
MAYTRGNQHMASRLLGIARQTLRSKLRECGLQTTQSMGTKGASHDDAPPLPPFTRDLAVIKVRLAEDGRNSRDPEKVAMAYSIDSRWRNRAEFVNGRNDIVAFLTRKWVKELDYRLINELWAFDGNRIAVRLAYESRDDSGNWSRSYENEIWEFAEDGLMLSRFACINDLPIKESDREFH